MFRHLQRNENSVLSQQSVELHDQIYKPADVSNTYSLIFPTSLFSIIVLRAEALGQSSVENGPKDSFVQSLSALQADSLTFLRLAPPWWPSQGYALCTARSGASEKHQHTKPSSLTEDALNTGESSQNQHQGLLQSPLCTKLPLFPRVLGYHSGHGSAAKPREVLSFI